MKNRLLFLLRESGLTAKRFAGLLAFICAAGTAQAEFVDLIALNSVPEDETATNVGIISLNNPNLAPPAGFENGFQTARENGRQIRYHIMDGNPNAWSAVVGNGIEYWQANGGGTLGVELCAGPRSRGVKQRFAMEASKDFCGGYALVWNHYGRVPKSGTLDYSYTVMITAGDPSAEGAQTIGTPLVIESARVPAGGTATECFFFGIGETDLPVIEKNGLWISITPNTTGTFSAVVSNLRIVKICMAVDKNRDRNVSFGGDDFTSASEPYRFWINNDSDKSGMSEDEVSAIDRSGSAEPDSNNEKPESIRDLEDFSRLQIRFFGDESGIDWLRGQLADGEIKTSLVVHGESVPAIRVVEHLDTDGSLRYLYDAENAVKDVSLSSKKSYVSIAVSEVADWTKTILGWLWGLVTRTENEMPETQSYFPLNFNDKSQANFLFEGIQEGLGKFTLVFSRSDAHLQETASVWLELLDVRKMFEQVELVGTNSSDSEKYYWRSDQFGSFRKPWDEEIGKQIVFIHGWNMEKAGTRSYAETAFKRLWWQNYTGRFSSVYWPTQTGATTYCPSEFIAWKCGNALSDYFDVLKNNGMSVNVMAHSMGNIVVGSALKEGAEIDKYVLMNAAIPAECYDDRSEIKQKKTTKTLTSLGLKFANTLNWAWNEYDAWALPSLGEDSNPDVTRLAYRGFLKNIKGNFFNFYLPEDFATEEAWEFNNATQKPWDGVGWTGSYSYTPGNIPTRANRFFISHNVTDRYEAMSFVDSSKTKVAGTEGRMQVNGGKIKSINMGDLHRKDGYSFNRTHSAQFVWTVQATWKFWTELKEVLNGELNDEK